MTLPADVQQHIDAIRLLLGVPACKMVVNVDHEGIVQGVEACVYFSRSKMEIDRRTAQR